MESMGCTDRANAWRFEQRLGRGGRGSAGAVRHRKRYRRLGSPAGFVVRNCRLQADRRAPDDPMPALRRGVAGLRLAVMPKVERTGVDREVLAAYDASVEVLRGLGAELRRVDLPCKFADFAASTGQIIGAEAYSILSEIVDRADLPVDPAVRLRVLSGKSLSARDYLLALSEREKLKQQFALALADIDALVTPTTATPAIPLADVDQSSTPAQFTRIVNLLDLCALSLPNGFTAAGLPTSLQIICKAHDEALALRIGWAYEQATDWLERIPSVM